MNWVSQETHTQACSRLWGENPAACQGHYYGEQGQAELKSPRAMMMSGLRLPGPKSRFMALLQSWFVSMSEAPDTAKDREDMTVQSWPLPSLPATWGRTGPAPPRLRHSGERTTTPSLGSTAELTLIRGGCGGVQVNQPWEQEHGRSGPTPQLPCGSIGRGEMTPPPQCLRQVGELPLPLTSCSIWESRP